MLKICEMEMRIINYWKQKTLVNLTKRIKYKRGRGSIEFNYSAEICGGFLQAQISCRYGCHFRRGK